MGDPDVDGAPEQEQFTNLPEEALKVLRAAETPFEKSDLRSARFCHNC